VDVSLSCRNISFSYNGFPVLQGIDLDVPTGDFCALLGRNGSGKTTLLHCLCGILQPAHGRIWVNGKPLSAGNGGARARHLSLVPQEMEQSFPFTVLDMVIMGRNPYLHGFSQPGPADEALAREAIDQVGAGHLIGRRVNQLSGGERQLIIVARAMAQQAPVMLLDEPSNHLDFHNQYKLLYTIRGLCQSRGLTVLASMHNPNAVAAVADRVVLLDDGRVQAEGPVEDILSPERLSRLYQMTVVESRLPGGIKHFMPVIGDG
jgi:iron complex transport system ATP-binding protein